MLFGLLEVRLESLAEFVARRGFRHFRKRFDQLILGAVEVFDFLNQMVTGIRYFRHSAATDTRDGHARRTRATDTRDGHARRTRATLMGSRLREIRLPAEP
jgi:hypothetical protein